MNWQKQKGYLEFEVQKIWTNSCDIFEYSNVSLGLSKNDEEI